VFAYRDETGLKADAVIEMPDGRWAAFEVKLGVAEVEGAAARLIKLRDRVDPSPTAEAIALGVITGIGYGYSRPDGVLVIPISSLGP
jgi:hypothetical protein